MTASQRYRSGDQALLRQINLSAIMHHLRESAPISRTALAELTGLNKTTVSSLINELIARQFVREVGLEKAQSGKGAGRLAVLLELDPAAGYIVSGEIGVDFISVICTNFAPEIIWRYQEKIKPDMGQRLIVDQALALLRQAATAGCQTCDTLLGVSLGVPGLVDHDNGTLLFAPNLGWRNVPLRTMLQDTFQTMVFVDNEANLAALGEHYFGAAQGYEEVLYISAGVGMGGGIVHNGQLFRGQTGVGAEFGHMTMDPHGKMCSCGNQGCWETQVSQRALFDDLRTAVLAGQDSCLARLVADQGDGLTVPAVVSAACTGDALAIEALQKVGRYLGIGIASLVNMLNPQLVVFGGILSLADDFLFPAIEVELQRRALSWNRAAMQLVLAHHRFDACVMGGVALVYQSILAEPGSAFVHRYNSLAGR